MYSIRFTFAPDTVARQNVYTCNLVLVYGRVFCHAERADFYALTHSPRTGILAEIHTFVDETAMSFHVTSAATLTVVTKTYKVSVTVRVKQKERERESLKGRNGSRCIDTLQQFAIDDILEDPSI